MSLFSGPLSSMNAAVLATFGDTARLIPQDGTAESNFMGVFARPAMDEEIIPNVVRFWVDLEHSATPTGPILPKRGDTVTISGVSYDVLEVASDPIDPSVVLKLRRNAI